MGTALKLLVPAILATIGTVGLLGAGLAEAPERQNSAAAAGRLLTPRDISILRNPSPPDAASARLVGGLVALRKSRLELASLPESLRPKQPDSGGMRWSLPDLDYWRTIPPEARAIPSDWSRLIEARIVNSKIDGERSIRLSIQGEYDLWLLDDPLHDITACISVHRRTRRVWFMQIARSSTGAWKPVRAKDACYSCHASGPRLLRPLPLPGVDRRVVYLFNRRMLSYGACDFGESIDKTARGPALEDNRCSGCHNDVDRGRLYAVHARLVQYKTEQEQTMPPAE